MPPEMATEPELEELGAEPAAAVAGPYSLELVHHLKISLCPSSWDSPTWLCPVWPWLPRIWAERKTLGGVGQSPELSNSAALAHAADVAAAVADDDGEEPHSPSRLQVPPDPDQQ